MNALSPPENDKSYSNSGLIEGAVCGNCLADCEEVKYTQELSQAELYSQSKVIEDLKNQKGSILYNFIKFIEKLENMIKNKTGEENAKIRKFLQEKLDDRKILMNEIIQDYSVVHIYFKELGIIKYTRDELFGIMDLIAVFGGVIGLCMGFSIISAIEIVYFFTMRMYVDYYRESSDDRKEKKKKLNDSVAFSDDTSIYR